MRKARLNKQNSGFSLIEIVLASAVFALFLSALVSSFLYGQENTRLAGDRYRATLLAEEGLEAIRGVRDEDFANLVDGTYGLALSGGQWVLSGSSDTTDGFTRQIDILTVDPERKRITSTVDWQQNQQRSGTVSVMNYLTNWSALGADDEAANLVVDSTNATTQVGDNTQVVGVTIDNAGGNDITITDLQISWTGGNPGGQINDISIAGNSVWSGADVSGAILDITDFVLNPTGGPWNIDTFDFNGSMTGTTITVLFIMSDTSERTEIINPALPGDTTAPATISDLTITGATSSSIDITWTAPGDDGVVGTATTYDVRYATFPITDLNWNLATQAIGEPTPSIAGSTETMTITGLTANTLYYVAIQTSDEVPNTSATSNSPNFSTLPLPTFRINEYYLGTGQFTGTNHTLTLNQNLMNDYFVIVQGSDGNGTNQGDRGPDENQARLTADPFGTGDLNTTAGADQLTITRQGSVDSWIGVVTVVECLNDCDQSGFRLIDVASVNHTGTTTTGTDTFASNWTTLNQVLLMGGFNGAGCTSTSTSVAEHKSCHTRLWPSGTNTINWERNAANITDAVSTVMAVEWGAQWNVQRVNVTGTNGGNGVDAISEYNTTTITSVNRDNTWVWGTGWTADNGIGDSAESGVITLGDGVNQNTTETQVAVGLEYTDNKSFDVYVMNHPNATVDYQFKTDGNSNDLIYDAATDTITNTTARMAIAYNGQNGTGTAFPRPMFSARYLNDSTIRMERRRYGQAFPAWIQGIDLSGITEQTVDFTAPATITDLALSGVTGSSIDIAWTAPGDDGVVGTATTYDVRYATFPITDLNWATATQATGEPTPSIAGSTETMTITGLAANTLYYVAIQTSDEVPNTSATSNSPSATTLQLYYFWDDFNRADNLVLGSPTPGPGGTWVEFEGGGNGVEISGQQFFFNSNNSSMRPMATATLSQPVNSGTIQWDFDLNAQRTGNDNLYEIWMQLGDASAMSDLIDQSGIAVALRWGDDGQAGCTSEECFGYENIFGSDTQVTTISGSAHIQVNVDFNAQTYDILVDGNPVASGIAFRTTVAEIDTIRFFTDGLNGNHFNGLTIDNVIVQ